ncbi:hypothetical protein ACNQVK_03240 [Mycobacterium sp. 134]|uniref:hypothetical protein n=1 Tax=Mycobacterium sp. 134 TaxID=3400425 RepID=UPI003AAE2D24
MAGPIPTDEAMPGWASAIAAAFWSTQDLRAERNAARAALVAKDQRLEEYWWMQPTSMPMDTSFVTI